MGRGCSIYHFPLHKLLISDIVGFTMKSSRISYLNMPCLLGQQAIGVSVMMANKLMRMPVLIKSPRKKTTSLPPNWAYVFIFMCEPNWGS